MIHKIDLLDPTSVENRSEYEKNVIDCAQNAGHGPRFMNNERKHGGAMQQVVHASAIIACECGASGFVSDISDGHSTLREVCDDICLHLAREREH